MERLRPYLDHGILELDNNAAERGMRAIALGSRLIDPHSQNMTVAASATADRKVLAHLS
jgi:hypothetical protein